LEVKEEKHAPKEVLDAAAFAKLFFRPSRRQTGTVLLILGGPRNTGHGPKHTMNPGNEVQAPRGGIESDDTGTNLIKTHGPCQQLLGNRSIV
jgi:hypothetical protein